MRASWWVRVLGAVVALACQRGPAATNQEASAASTTAPSTRTKAGSYLDRLGSFKTKLVRRGPSPQDFDPNERPPPGIREVTYVSDGLKLKAWLALPPAAKPTAKVAAVAYFHGGFAFGAADFEDARPFLDAGLAVMCPMLRGENGNPGDAELFFGEVRDARAAVAWLVSQPEVDAGHVYAFGHSAGGIVSSLLALHDVPIRHSGSAGAMYGPELFEGMAEVVPFQRNDPEEAALRLLLGNTAWLRLPHYTYMGKEDAMQRFDDARAASKSHGLLHAAIVPGDHFKSLAPAVAAYLAVIKASP